MYLKAIVYIMMRFDVPQPLFHVQVQMNLNALFGYAYILSCLFVCMLEIHHYKLYYQVQLHLE